MKKSICILLSIISILGIFVGCGETVTQTTTTTQSSTTATQTPTNITTVQQGSSSTDNSSTESTTLVADPTTTTKTNSTTKPNTTTSKTVTSTSNSYSYPFETKKSMIVKVVSWRNENVVECEVLQHVSQGSSLAAIGETVYVEFDNNTTIYSPDAGKLPVKRLPTRTDFPANDTEIIITLDNNEPFFPKSLHVKKIAPAERLALLMKYKANNPNLNVATYELDFSGYGSLLSFATDNDRVYLIYKKPNQFVEVNTNTGKKIREASLPDTPSKIRVYDNEIWISYPNLKAIGIYDRSTFTLIDEIILDHDINSFDVSGKYIVYSTSNQHAHVYRYNMETEQCLQVGSSTFRVYGADILINADKNVFYINESGSTETAIICFDLLSLEKLSVEVAASSGASTNYKITNSIKNTVLFNGALYWTTLKLDPVKVHIVNSSIKTNYKAGSIALYSVDKNYWCTSNGIYDTNSTKLISSFSTNYSGCFILCTSSGNLVMLYRGTMSIVKK